MLKHTLSVFLLFLSLPLFAETEYFGGERIERTTSGEESRKSLVGSVTSTETSREWSIVRCELPGNINCLSYEVAVKKGTDGKWNFFHPSPVGMIQVPIITDSKEGVPADFHTKWNGTDGKLICLFEQKTDGVKTIWNQKVLDGGQWLTVTTRISPMPKNIYDGIKSKRKAKPFL